MLEWKAADTVFVTMNFSFQVHTHTWREKADQEANAQLYKIKFDQICRLFPVVFEKLLKNLPLWSGEK